MVSSELPDQLGQEQGPNALEQGVLGVQQVGTGIGAVKVTPGIQLGHVSFGVNPEGIERQTRLTAFSCLQFTVQHTDWKQVSLHSRLMVLLQNQYFEQIQSEGILHGS